MSRIIRTALLSSLFVLCCTALSAQRKLTPEEYIEKHRKLVVVEQEIYGIPASIKMAQALLESDCGNSRLALEGNNHFGIKCKRDWTGETILHDDDELQECFRKYGTAEASFRDHSEFLDKSSRYQALFELDPADYKGWARGLKEAGYATNPRYADLLINMIERYELFRLDAEELSADDLARIALATGGNAGATVVAPPVADESQGPPPAKIDVDNYVVSVSRMGDYAVFQNNGSEFVVARRGDTYESLAYETGVSASKLRKFNDADKGRQPVEGEPVYVRAKSNRAHNGKLMHIARENETLHYVSQMYGIKLPRLSKLNRLPAQTRLSTGQQVRLM